MTIEEIYNDIMLNDNIGIRSMINLIDFVIITDYMVDEPVFLSLKFKINQTNWINQYLISQHLQKFKEIKKISYSKNNNIITGYVYFSDYDEYNKCKQSKLSYYDGLYLFY